MSLTLAEIFGDGGIDIAVRIEEFDWTSIDVSDGQYSEHLHRELAPSYGALNRESIRTLDDDLKVVIAGIMRQCSNLSRMPSDQRTWHHIEAAMMNNPLQEPAGDFVSRLDKIVKDDVNYFKVDQSPDNSVVQEVFAWWTKLIDDQDVLHTTKIDKNLMANIVAQTGAIIDSLQTAWSKDEAHEQTLLDIGVLRFPDPQHPYFKHYRIKFSAWTDSERVGITGEYYARKFKPRRFVIGGMRSDTRDKAMWEAEGYFA